MKILCVLYDDPKDGEPIRNQYLIVKDGELAGMGAHSYSKGSATGGSEEAAKYNK